MNKIELLLLKPFYKMVNLYRKKKKPFSKYSIKKSNETNEIIKKIIKKGEPAMISRFGSEINVLNVYMQRQRTRLKQYVYYLNYGIIDKYNEKVRHVIWNNNGVFPTTDVLLDEFSEITINASKNIDVLGVWEFLPLEENLFKSTCPNAILVYPKDCEPYYHDKPWTMELENKKVLVIHPFARSIKKQYEKRDKLFANPEILPNFKLLTLQAVQSIAGNKVGYASWVDALEDMEKQIDNIDFDVAIIGAGAYGLPLASYVKEKGKISIHLGGSVQILFGIKGKRWDNHPIISKLYNEYWIRPDETETPKSFIHVENGCYW